MFFLSDAIELAAVIYLGVADFQNTFTDIQILFAELDGFK